MFTVMFDSIMLENLDQRTSKLMLNSYRQIFMSIHNSCINWRKKLENHLVIFTFTHFRLEEILRYNSSCFLFVVFCRGCFFYITFIIFILFVIILSSFLMNFNCILGFYITLLSVFEKAYMVFAKNI